MMNMAISIGCMEVGFVANRIAPRRAVGQPGQGGGYFIERVRRQLA